MTPNHDKGQVLIVEDDEDTRLALCEAVRDLGYEVVAEGSAEDALESARGRDFGVVLSDIRMGAMDGIELCARLSGDGRGCPIIVMTAFGDASSATAALRAGAFDFLTKPFTLRQLSTVLDRAFQQASRTLHLRRLPAHAIPPDAVRGLLGDTAAIKAVREAIAFAAPTEATVLVTGESGTGKELVAKAIHDASHRADGPFVAVSCAALPGSVLEAEFFGCLKGAFTGATEARAGFLAQAEGGTLFLDEIGDMPLDLQPKLLRALQQRVVRPLGSHEEKAVDVRIVAATNVNLEAKVATGEFREDLYYRLNTIGIHVPPLRERAPDVPVLARHFMNRLAQAHGRSYQLSPEAESALRRHGWPGNVRELENCIEAAVALAHGTVIEVGDLRLQSDLSEGRSQQRDESTLEAVERRHIAAVLARLHWNKALVAHKLGIDRATLYRKMKRYGLVRRP
jgi:DNA-binding NtrC family response regulator